MKYPKRNVCRMFDLGEADSAHFITRVTSHIPDKGQVTVRYYGLYANAQFSLTTAS